MKEMPNMLAYTIRGGGTSDNCTPEICIGQGPSKAILFPSKPQNDMYWIAILDRNNPKALVKEFIWPGSQNAKVPDGLDYYMINPQNMFAVTTQSLSMLHLPQGDWYHYLMKYGAGRELQRLEQIATSLSCGTFQRAGYVLTGLCGVRDHPPSPPPPPDPPSYELSTITNYWTLLTMSLMPGPNGPPYALCESYTSSVQHAL